MVDAAAAVATLTRSEVFFSSPQQVRVPQAQAFGIAALPLSRRRGAERQRVFKGLLFERSEFTGPPLA